MGTELAEPGGRERSRRRAWKLDSEIDGENDAEGPDNLDFLFCSRLYSVEALTTERRTGGQVRRDGL